MAPVKRCLRFLTSWLRNSQFARTLGDDALVPDNDFAPDEELYRRIRATHVVNGRVIGAGVELGFPPACSFNRSKYSVPEDVFDTTKPEDNGIAFTQVARASFQASTTGGVAWETVVAHAPIQGNRSHTEVRLKRSGETYDPKRRPGSDAFKKRIRELLAARLEILREPTLT